MRFIPILDPAISMDEEGADAWKDPQTGANYPPYTRGLEKGTLFLLVFLPNSLFFLESKF